MGIPLTDEQLKAADVCYSETATGNRSKLCKTVMQNQRPCLEIEACNLLGGPELFRAQRGLTRGLLLRGKDHLSQAALVVLLQPPSVLAFLIFSPTCCTSKNVAVGLSIA